MKLSDKFGTAGYTLVFAAIAMHTWLPKEVFSDLFLGAGVAFIIAAVCTPEGDHQ